MRKGRHRRFEEARALQRQNEPDEEPCAECGADPEDDHASWCLAPVEDMLDEKEAAEKWTTVLGSTTTASTNGSSTQETGAANGVATEAPS